MRKVSVFLLLAFFLYSCNSGVDTQALKNEVLDIHDEVMPKMGELMSLRKKVMAKSKALKTEENHDQSDVNSLDSLAAALESANKGMMTWMNEWSNNSSKFLNQDGKPIAGVTVEAVVKYLNDEKQLIEKVNENFNATIKEAKAVLNK
jgi:ABC-type transporter Mla subunit MlaD